MNERVVVRKLNLERRETWRYDGRVLRRLPGAVLLEAFFNREDMLFHGITFGRNDRFMEAYYSDRWYNIYEMHDRDDDHLKGWYCNVSLPAELGAGQISYVDLALDLLVFPDGRQLVLDEDEFSALPLDDASRARAVDALTDLRRLFQRPETFQLDLYLI